MKNSNSYVSYQIDNKNRIVNLSDEWEILAKGHNALHLTKQALIDKNFFDYISGIECQEIYNMLITRSRKNNTDLNFQMRCDSPDKRRLMSMHIIPLKLGGIEFRSWLENEQAREPVLFLDLKADRSEKFITVCSWCNRVMYDEDNWLEVEQAITKMDMFNDILFPQISHGMCPSCYVNVRNEIFMFDDHT